jgi:hypothetical protein
MKEIIKTFRRKIYAGFDFIKYRSDRLNYKRLSEFKDIHKGKRAFVIGSGPSLRVSDVDRLKNEVTFACNKIYLAFNETEWRPTYYSVIDRMVAKNNSDMIQSLKLRKIFSSGVKPYLTKSKDILWLKDLPAPIINGERRIQFSKDLQKGTYGGSTVIYTMLQLAYYMGIREIYLLGIDFSFQVSPPTGEKTTAGEILLKNEGEENHFHPDYRKQGELWTMPRMDDQYDAFKVAKTAFEEKGGIIKNASRKTALDVFPLVDFERVI